MSRPSTSADAPTTKVVDRHVVGLMVLGMVVVVVSETALVTAGTLGVVLAIASFVAAGVAAVTWVVRLGRSEGVI